MRTRVLVIPGKMASRLQYTDTHSSVVFQERIWEPGVTGEFSVLLNPYKKMELADDGIANQDGGTVWPLGGLVPQAALTHLRKLASQRLFYQDPTQASLTSPLSDRTDSPWVVNGYYKELLIALAKGVQPGTGFPIQGDAYMVPYDWRLSVTQAAAYLLTWIAIQDVKLSTLYSNPASDDLMLVCHSQGGLVARLAWKLGGTAFQNRVKRIVCMGTPHWGCWDVIRGFYHNDALWKQLFEVTKWADVGSGIVGQRMKGQADELDRAMTSFPALYELLPDPYGGQVLWTSDATRWYQSTSYPDELGIKQVSTLRLQRRLNEALATTQLLNDPTTKPPSNILLDVFNDTLIAATGIVDQTAPQKEFVPGTTGAIVKPNYNTGPGDGRVLATSAQLYQGKGRKVIGEHFALPTAVAPVIIDLLTETLPAPSPPQPQPGIQYPPQGIIAQPPPPPPPTAPAATPVTTSPTRSGIPGPVPSVPPPPPPKSWGPGPFSPGSNPLGGN